jgi:hypothetical protein
MAAILDGEVMSNFRYVGATVGGRAHFSNSFHLVEKAMIVGYLAHMWLLQYGRKRRMFQLIPLGEFCRY